MVFWSGLRPRVAKKSLKTAASAVALGWEFKSRDIMAEAGNKPRSRILKQRFITNQMFLLVNKNHHQPLAKPIIYYRIGKKVVSKAVDRNLLKRRLREIMREYKDKIPLGTVLSIGVSENIVKKPFKQLKADLNLTLTKTHLL
jgi:ribonuclease P protein component